MFESSAVELLKHSKAAYGLTVNTPVKAKKAVVINWVNNSAVIAALRLCGDNINRKIYRILYGKYVLKMQCKRLAAIKSAAPNSIAFFTYMRKTDAAANTTDPA